MPTIQYSKQAIKFLSKQNLQTKKHIIHVIEKLPNGDVNKLQGRSGYRLRIGDFRVIFDRDGNNIMVSKIGSRGQVYKQ